MAAQTPNLLLARCGVVAPTSIADYEAHGGFAALRRAIEAGPEWVIDQVARSRLLGRGGALFPMGRKWEAVRSAAGGPKYVVLNADESELGTFKDRKLLEEDPFALVEAMAIAGMAVGSTRGYAYIRGEYALASRTFQAAIAAARASGYLGPSILGSGQSFDIEVRRGGGAYICGEETSLFNSMEGRRGEPRTKPPFPVTSGIFRKPTVINNVETLANVPHIVLMGGDAFAQIGAPTFTGPKLYSISGHIRRPGVYEVAAGGTLRELLDLAGGMPDGSTLQAVLLGGAAGAFVPLDQLDIPLRPDTLGPLGLTIGSGAVMVFDSTVNMWDVTHQLAEFFAEESCGQCVPCRVGTQRQVEILERLTVGQGRPEDTALLQELGAVMTDASICGLGQTASSAVVSALRVFPLPAGTGGHHG